MLDNCPLNYLYLYIIFCDNKLLSDSEKKSNILKSNNLNNFKQFIFIFIQSSLLEGDYYSVKFSQAL